MLESVREHKRNQLAEAKAVTAALEAEWARMTPDFDPSFQTISGNLYTVTALAQERAARDAIEYVPQVLDERGTATTPVARVEPKAFTGVTGGGYSLMTEFKTSVIRMKQAVATGASVFVALKLGRSHMLRVAQTAIADAGRGAERVTMATNKCGGYVRVVTLPSCPKCLILAGRVYGSEEAFKRHPHCFPEGVVASGPALDAATRRWYEGELVVLTTASGQELPVTGNHPVLTRRGWVPANLLNEGDEVFRSTRPEGASSLVVPDHDQVPARVEDIWSAFAVAGLDTVESTPEDFHGDGQDGKVNIVWSDRSLNNRAVPAFFQHGFEQNLAGGTGATFSLYGEGAPEVLDLWDASVAGSLVGRGNLSLPLSRRHGFVPGFSCGAHVTQFDSHVGHAFSDRASGDRVLAGQRVQTGTGFVLPDDLSHGDISSGFPRWDAPGAKFSVETRGGYASAGLNLLHRLSGQVEADRIVKLVRRDFRGHVYSLSSSEGWHVANSLIVSNCDCRHVPFSERGDVRDDEVLNPSEAFDRLPTRQQDEIFGQADAEAIRSGADIYQVVNARRGMYTTADGFTYTREGTTRRGLYQLRQQTLGTPGRRRYTPEQIQKVATSKDHYLQLLKTYGYIF